MYVITKKLHRAAQENKVKKGNKNGCHYSPAHSDTGRKDNSPDTPYQIYLTFSARTIGLNGK